MGPVHKSGCSMGLRQLAAWGYSLTNDDSGENSKTFIAHVGPRLAGFIGENGMAGPKAGFSSAFFMTWFGSLVATNHHLDP